MFSYHVTDQKLYLWYIPKARWLTDQYKFTPDIKSIYQKCLLIVFLSFDWLIYDWVRDLTVPMHRGLNWRALCAPYINLCEPCYFAKVPGGPRLNSWCPLAPRIRCPDKHVLSEVKASHSQRMWAEVSSSAAHLLNNGLSDSPIRWRCLLRVLCPVRRPVTALDFVLLKDRNLALPPRQGSCSLFC